MSNFLPADESLLGLDFDALSPARRLRIFGVDYAQFRLQDGGEIFVTRLGWPWTDHLRPTRWYVDQRFAREGERLAGGTGTVYRMPAVDDRGWRRDLVVKFSRFGQVVPVYTAGTLPPGVSHELVQQATWNDPFEEFGRVMDLRRGRFGPASLHIRTKHPLAIYSPAREFAPWQLARDATAFETHNMHLEHDLHSTAIRLHMARDYVLLYAWIKGVDVERLGAEGVLSEDEVEGLTIRSGNDLLGKGFRVLDHKPKHVILRRRADGSLVRRDGEIVYALVDFELLQRTDSYLEWLRERTGLTADEAAG